MPKMGDGSALKVCFSIEDAGETAWPESNLVSFASGISELDNQRRSCGQSEISPKFNFISFQF